MNPQGSPEWLKERCGIVTASRFKDVMATIRSGEAAAYSNYKAEIIAERLTGHPSEAFTSQAMQWGSEHEPEARRLYELINDVEVEQVGLVKMADDFGASPDGLIPSAGGSIEIKCPSTWTHIQTLLAGRMPTIHIPQVQGVMAVTGTNWCDFISYDPRLNDKLAVFIVRVERDEDYIAELNHKLAEFMVDVKTSIKELEAIK